MKEVALSAQSREAATKGHARRVRMEGMIPAIVYGPEFKPTPVSVEEKALRAAFRSAGGGNALFNLATDGKQTKVIVREVQRDPVTSRVIHVDFHAISMTKPLHISVPIHYIGTATGVKNEGGILQLVERVLEISCLPTNIPEFVEVDVTNLAIGDSIHVRDLNLPGVNIMADKDRTLVVVTAPTVIKVETPTAAVEGAEAAPAAAGAAPATGAPGATPAATGAAPAKKEGEKKPEKK
jgi:large subunit ribosomal protein L25